MEWFESESFWLNYSPVMFDDNRWREAPAVAEHVRRIAGLGRGASVLDAGCGLGRISVELAMLGLDVTGVDLIECELDAARSLAQDEGVPLRLVQADLRDFCAPGQFDCAVNLYTSFGYCNSMEDDFLILKNIADSVKKGGALILECVSRETAVLYFTSGEEFERAGMTVRTEFSVEGAWEGLRSRWILMHKDGRKIEHEFVQRLYTASFLRDKLIDFGFSQASVYGDFDFSPYDQNARTMVLVGKK